MGVNLESVDITQGSLLPGTHIFENIRNLFENYNVGSALFNSFFIAIIATVLCLVISSLAGYGFEIYRSKGKDIVFNILLLSMMIPFAALMVPLFRFFGNVSQAIPAIGVDTLYAVILPYVTTAFFVFFFRQNTKMFTRDLIEAGRIDGLSELGIFFRIYMPSMKNTLAAAGIISFMNNWNNYLWPLVMLQSSDVQTIPLLIFLI